MADLFKLPDGRRVRRGSDFALPHVAMIVEPAIVGTDAKGNQRIEKPARETQQKREKYFPSNWLHVATPAMLKAEGIEPLEEDRDADPRYFHTGEGPIKNGRLTKIAKPRPIKDIQGMLLREVDDATRSQILSRFPIEKQLTMLRHRDSADAGQADAAADGFVWIEKVLAYGKKLQYEIAKLPNAAAAQKWQAKPRAWPANPDAKEDGPR